MTGRAETYRRMIGCGKDLSPVHGAVVGHFHRAGACGRDNSKTLRDGAGRGGAGNARGGAHHDTNGDGDEWGVLGTRGQRLSLRNRGGWWMSALMNIQRREVTGNGQKHRGVNGVGNKA